MPTYIIKPSRAEDFYVWWSTVVDCPVGWGPRNDQEDPERFKRADKTGTSVRWRAEGYPLDGSWEDRDPLYLREQDDLPYEVDGVEVWWFLPRDNLREFCRRRDAGEAVRDLVKFAPVEEEQP